MTIPQQSVNLYVAPGIAGDFCSANPRHTFLAGEGAITAGVGGCSTSVFAFVNSATMTATNAHPGVTSRIGFVHRNQPALMATTPFTAGTTVPQGYGVTLFDGGDFWMQFAAGATMGQKVYAKYADGTAVAAATASAPTSTVSVTTASGSPNLTAVGAGVYPGMPISGAGIPAGAYIVSVGTGTAVMSANATASATITATITTAVETAWYVDSTALAGEIAKTSIRG